MDEERQERWEQRSETPLMIASAVFLIAYAVRVLAFGIGPRWRGVCDAVQWGVWAVFVIDYLARLWLAPHRWRWFFRHLFDLAVIALPMIRPLRLLRLVTMLGMINRRAAVTLRGQVMAYLVGGSSLLWFVASLAVLDAERGASGGNIHTFAQAGWWALVTMTTVGYGDTYPVTLTGRCVAAGLMICGIALLGTVTATLASWLSDRVRADEANSDDVLRELRELRAEVRQLRTDIGHEAASDQSAS